MLNSAEPHECSFKDEPTFYSKYVELIVFWITLHVTFDKKK